MICVFLLASFQTAAAFKLQVSSSNGRQTYFPKCVNPSCFTGAESNRCLPTHRRNHGRFGRRSVTPQANLLGNIFGEPETALGRGMSVVKLQVAVRCLDRSPSSTVALLAQKAETAITDTPRGLARLVSDVTLALTRKRDDWVACSSETTHFGSSDKAESAYNKMVNRELAKFEKEYVPPAGTFRGDDSTLAVVSILLAIRGDKTNFPNVGGNAAALAGALEMVGTDVVTGGGELLVAAELLWTPSEADEVLEKRDLILDYPELIDI
eukprot:CAMPEP_0185756376 /NCGR_PEP_ID=MMETSP1174-20130828/14812_1 /TAXON_ID=35687 /ORGANISM="Dictyocha speculum, Strain CCMP1381" /LENGTH=266 /DNA_ID=CAMNT_0028435319 /DNA_START=125 /DNA_END=925 /DNA_ORIENTATION=-